MIALREPDKPLRAEHDHFTRGVFPVSSWQRLIEEAGLRVVDPGVADPFAGEHAVFVARKSA